ncbi:hypothetical protein BRARA_C03907 [Brassica rapa]|uniref:C2H2-type domain-containing protein n=2 Tax=Brassica TaxID=3705 RepID=A0A398A2F4_BRACM|nr:transcriptional regulator SUPERMAN [Brassica rapa]XP_048632532.1 transcriptional regulator SUPERMAN-like [Brassica napus]RID71997.1 hypothetical protein BRARA_C03907 [Brassica rapa]CAF2128538.1 unnamed protein product [Brassica napus]CAG7882998.1 unnamed protein product [Brassica rapa]CDY71008.1 BnaA03g57610D [Brassica napus]VDC82240.1 unnamed protein product [Brassica rapa]
MNNRHKQIDSGSGSGDNRRMYDCDICMRGFTSPQALGGHRNIHRKERERNLSSSSSSSHSFPFLMPSSRNYTNPNYNNPPPYFPTNESYHHQTFQPPVNPSYNAQRFGSTPSSGGGSYAQGELLGLDLSLRLGSVNVGNDSHRSLPDAGDSKPDQDEDLDLDLRLGGHHHH